MMRAALRTAGIVTGFYLSLYAFGPMVFVVGGITFLGGFALGHLVGHRAGEREATTEAARRIMAHWIEREGRP